MAVERMPITPQVLTWARERAGYSATDLKYSFAAIEAWETGAARPSYRELEELAERFQVPIAVFFFPEPPSLPRPSFTFRTLGSNAFERFSLRMQCLIERTQYRQRNFAELCAKSPPPRSLIVHDLRISADNDTENIATKIRDYLGVSVAKQFEWSKQNKTLDNWRKLFLDVGISVFLEDFRQDDIASFALYDPRFPIICVDRTCYDWGEALLTTCHSLIHLLFHTSGVDRCDPVFLEGLDTDGTLIEKLCDRLSTEIVVPDAVLMSEFSARYVISNLPQLTSELGHLFGVGERWMNDRLFNLDLITDIQHKETLDTWARRRGGGGGGGDETLEAYLTFGEAYIRLAFGCYDSNGIDEMELADYLEISPRLLDGLRELVESRA